MRNDKMRDEFDSWIERQGMSTMKDGETYYHRVTHVAWQAWKASRAAPDIAVQGEPVATVTEEVFGSDGTSDFISAQLPVGTKLYATPQPAEQQPELAKYQPCGCVICTCEHETQCQGCGAHHCGGHPVGEFSKPAYQQPGLTEALRQYQHNDGSGLVFGYDKLLVDRHVAQLVEALSALRGCIMETRGPNAHSALVLADAALAASKEMGNDLSN